uniref:Ras-associating domain-containing protein n=1 Tax=Anopheles farauti TaxID=69004 RepID=A0A182QT57_9DIPT
MPRQTKQPATNATDPIMAPQNSTLIHNDSTEGGTAATSAEELTNFSPILPPRNHHHHHHHRHHHHHHRNRSQQRHTANSHSPSAEDDDEGVPFVTSSPGEASGTVQSATTHTTSKDESAGGTKLTHTMTTVRPSTSRGGSFRGGIVVGPTDHRVTSSGDFTELQSLPAGWSGCEGAVGRPSVGTTHLRTCGTGRGTVKRELLDSIPFHSHTHGAKPIDLAESTSPESDGNGTVDTDTDAYEERPEDDPSGRQPSQPTATTAAGETDVPVTDIEIPIWIRGEARFVSGINGTTTCSNIIRALIDDEIQSGNYGPEDVAVSRDVSDYVIIERWREVEQVLAGDTRILSIWHAWGDAKNEVQFRLKINKTNLDKGAGGKENKSKKQKEKIGLINRMMRKVLKQGEAIQNHLSQISQKSTEKRQQEKFRKYVRKNCGKHLILENFLHDAAATGGGGHLSDVSVDGEPLVAEVRDTKDPAKVRRSTFPGKLLFSAKRGSSSAAGASKDRPEDRPGRVLKNVLFESSDQLADGTKTNEDELLLVIDHTSDSDSGIFTNNNNQALSRRDTLPKRPNFGSMVEIDRYAKDVDGPCEGPEHEELEEDVSSARRQQKYHRSKRRYDSLRCQHQSRGRDLEYALSEDDGVASSSGGGRSSADRDQELVELVNSNDDDGSGDEQDDQNFTPPVDDFEAGEQFELRKGTFNRTSFRFDLIRQEIDTKMAEMQHLLEHEEELLRRLKLKSAKFHAENQIYRSHIGLDFHVERLQQSIDRCAKEIIDIEQQLLETKMEIEEKSPLIDNLRALLEAQEAGGQCYRRPKDARQRAPPVQRYGMTTHFRTGSVDGVGPGALNADTSFTHTPQTVPTADGTGKGGCSSRNSLAAPKQANESVEFVDNIYEFCDNNQSFVV